MPPRWLHHIDSKGLWVDPEFYKLALTGSAKARAALLKVQLTPLYRAGFTRATPEDMQPDIFGAEAQPSLKLIPYIKRPRNEIPAWIVDYISLKDHPKSKKQMKAALGVARSLGKGLSADERQKIEIKDEPEKHINTIGKTGPRYRYEKAGYSVTATRMKANPKFELVVVNKHDKAALLKLLAEIDKDTNVELWLRERTKPEGATLSSALYNDYATWCLERNETATGPKRFAQSLVSLGATKLIRANGGERYGLELMPQKQR